VLVPTLRASQLGGVGSMWRRSGGPPHGASFCKAFKGSHDGYTVVR
jgi:hypothetical protein